MGSVGLANAAMVPALILVSLPVLIHLFARAKPKVIAFAATLWLEEAVRESMRIRRPQSWLLMVLRTVAVMALVGMFLKPVLYGDLRMTPRSVAKTVVVLLDETASMGAVEGGQARFAAACARAGEILRSLGEDDLANVVWLGRPVRSEFFEPGLNHGSLIRAVNGARCGMGTGAAEDGVAEALRQLEKGQGVRELHILSDFQRATWGSMRWERLDAVRVFATRVGKGDAGNQALVRIAMAPRAPLIGQAVTMTCEVENFSNEPAMRTVFLKGSDIVQSQEVHVAPWARAAATFLVRWADAGERVLRAELSEDAFPGDNVRWAVARVRSEMRVGLGGLGAEREFWQRAVSALGWVQAREVRLDDPMSWSGLDVVMLAGWDGRQAEAAAGFAQRGRGVWWIPDAGVPWGRFRPILGADLEDQERPVEIRLSREPYEMRVPDFGHLAMRVFEGGGQGDPGGRSVRARIEGIDTRAVGEAIVAFGDGVPAVAHRAVGDGGAVVFWNILMDPSWSDYGSKPEFVPLVGELLRTSSGAGEARWTPEVTPGERLRLTPDETLLAEEVALLRGEESIAIEREETGDFVSDPVTQPGVYEWSVRGEAARIQLVQFPVDESDLRCGEPAARQGAGPSTTVLPADERVADLRDGLALWPFLLAIAVGALLAESSVVAWARGVRT